MIATIGGINRGAKVSTVGAFGTKQKSTVK